MFTLFNVIIIFVGLKKAWTLAAKTVPSISGPYRVGDAAAPAPVGR